MFKILTFWKFSFLKKKFQFSQNYGKINFGAKQVLPEIYILILILKDVQECAHQTQNWMLN